MQRQRRTQTSLKRFTGLTWPLSALNYSLLPRAPCLSRCPPRCWLPLWPLCWPCCLFSLSFLPPFPPCSERLLVLLCLFFLSGMFPPNFFVKIWSRRARKALLILCPLQVQCQQPARVSLRLPGIIRARPALPMGPTKALADAVAVGRGSFTQHSDVCYPLRTRKTQTCRQRNAIIRPTPLLDRARYWLSSTLRQRAKSDATRPPVEGQAELSVTQSLAGRD